MKQNKLFKLWLLAVILFAGSEVTWGTDLINENIQSWTNRGSYGSHTQVITAGTVSMTRCIVSNNAAATGTCSAGRVQMEASTGIIELPALSSVGTSEFHLVAGGAGRTIKLQKYNGSTWDDLTTFTGIGTTGTTFTYNVNSSSSTTLRLASPSAALYVHDIIVTDYAGSTPTITATGTFSNFTTTTGTPSTSQSIAVSGANLTANIQVAALAGYEYSTTDTAPWSSSLTLASTYNGNVYVRLTGASAGTFNGNIAISSTGATTVNKSVTGTVSAPPPPSAPTATAATSVGTTGFTANWDAVSGATRYKLDVYTKTGGGNASDLFISEYIEGSSNNKAIEIYNGTGGSVDLSGYVLRHYNNGSSTPTYSLSLSGTLANDDVYIIVNSSSTIFSGVDLSTNSNVMTFNGNDAIALYKNSTSSNIDVVGTIGDASDWGANITLVRKSAASVPSTTYSASDWDSYGNDVTTYLGSHTFAGGGSNSYVSGYQDLTVSGTSQAVSGLASGTTYYYVVRATNANGTSDNSNEISVTTSSATPTITVTELTIPAMSAVANSTTDSETINIGGTNLTGDITVTIDGTNAAMFSVVTNPSPLTSAGGTATITYTPTATGTHTATLRINSTGATEVTRELNGTATAAAITGEVIITEVYGGGGNQFATFQNDFIELYNTTDNPVNISGWSVQYYSATGTGLPASKIDISTGTIPAKGYFLVQASSGGTTTSLNLPAPDASGTSISMSSSTGKVILYNTTEAQTIDASSLTSITGNSYYVDYVPFGTDAIPVYGSAMSVNTTNAFSAQRKSSAGAFAYTGNIGNDFEVSYPTPQNTTGNVVYYRTKGSGNWSSTAIWEKLTTNPEWAEASTAPTSSEAFVYIENGDELTVNSEVTSPSVVVKPNGKLTVTSGGTLPITGDLIIENNIVDGPGTITNNGSLTVSGNTFINQYVNSARNWYMSASSGANAPTGNTYYEYLEDGSNTGFTAPASEYWKLVSSGTALTAGKGYIVATSGAKTITFTGAINNGNVPVSLTRTTGATKEGFNLVGNPYPSYIKWLESTATAANAEPTIWYRTHNGSGYEFQTYNAPSGVGVPSSASGYIPPMQAFWVRVIPTKTTGTLTFTNALRLHNDGTFSSLKAPAAKNSDRQLIRLQVSNGSTTDELVIYSNSNASNGFDAYDSPKMLNGSTSAVPDMYTTAGSEKVVINGLNTLPLDVVIPVSFAANNTVATSFTISANEISNLPSGVTVKVVDNNVETSLSDGGTYTFTANSGTTKTFGLVLRSPGFTTDVSNNSNNQFSVFVNANGKVLVNLNEKLNENTFISIFNAVGQQIIRQQITATTAEVNQALIPGVYLVQVNNGKISLTSKVIVR